MKTPMYVNLMLKSNVSNRLQVIIGALVVILFSGCGTNVKKTPDHSTATESEGLTVVPKQIEFIGDANKPKNIFVFLDGTQNDKESGTNVWRVNDAVSKNKDAQTTSIYIEGVGTTSNPMLGTALGKGMEARILEGYGFIAKNFRPGDTIYIFGFSRGAHEARDLAGLIAYAGVPKLANSDLNKLTTISNRILELTKTKSDIDYLA